MNSVERVKAICKERGIAISKLEKSLGFSNGYIGQLRKGIFPSDRLDMIANFLNVDRDYLLYGEKEKTPTLTNKDERDIEKRMADILKDLENQDGLMYSGEPMDDADRELLATSIRNSMEIGKKLAKQKYTPKKYRKE